MKCSLNGFTSDIIQKSNKCHRRDKLFLCKTLNSNFLFKNLSLDLNCITLRVSTVGFSIHLIHLEQAPKTQKTELLGVQNTVFSKMMTLDYIPVFSKRALQRIYL